jgi:hypothetical protein
VRSWPAVQDAFGSVPVVSPGETPSAEMSVSLVALDPRPAWKSLSTAFAARVMKS